MDSNQFRECEWFEAASYETQTTGGICKQFASYEEETQTIARICKQFAVAYSSAPAASLSMKLVGLADGICSATNARYCPSGENSNPPNSSSAYTWRWKR